MEVENAFFYCFSEELYNINVPIEEQKQNKADLYLKKLEKNGLMQFVISNAKTLY